MRGLPSKVMSIAVFTAWILSGLPFVTYATAAGITLSIAWFLVKLFKR